MGRRNILRHRLWKVLSSRESLKPNTRISRLRAARCCMFRVYGFGSALGVGRLKGTRNFQSSRDVGKRVLVTGRRPCPKLPASRKVGVVLLGEPQALRSKAKMRLRF